MSQMKDVVITSSHPTKLLNAKHVNYIAEFSKKKNDFEYVMTEHFRLSGMYWGITAIDLLGQLELMDKAEIINFIKKCHLKDGGFSPSIDHDSHILYTLSAVQILLIIDAIDEVDTEKIANYIAGLQNVNGSFCGDEWGKDSIEVDTRYSFCAVACLSLLKKLDKIDKESAFNFIIKCQNIDGGFGTRPGSESHAGQVYCCVGLLSILGKLHFINADLLGWWLAERQLPSGGLNGRPEKLPDVCYSWWVLASLRMLGRMSWIDENKMKQFILATQDPETGGFTDRPGDVVDIYHTLFGLAGLSLLGEPSLKEVNPAFCMPEEVLTRISVKMTMLEF